MFIHKVPKSKAQCADLLCAPSLCQERVRNLGRAARACEVGGLPRRPIECTFLARKGTVVLSSNSEQGNCL